ncbi:MAG: sulfatase-like hydrolase/transferase [Planctomycetia bacterium]|nr:sulfatase-like hydrolase/transferase [Planctomycetia bacterium]
MNVICLLVDRLHVGYLGCYGNSWVETPHFDRLAAEGFLFDQALIESPDLVEQYASYMTGQHLFERLAGTAPRDTLVARLAAAGIATTLITDDPRVAAMPWAADADDVIDVPCEAARRAAESIGQTQLARFFAVAGGWLESVEEPFCLWLHTRSLGLAWDAPLDLRRRYADEDEPRPPDTTAVPCRLLPENYDPDDLLGICQSYAGQVTLLDACLGALWEEIEQLPTAEQTLLVVMSGRGFPLGEHRRIGPVDDAIYAETAHVPWIMRLPDRQAASARGSSLVQPCDFAPTIVDWLGLSAADERGFGRSVLPLVRGDAETLRDRALVAAPSGERAIRTPAWYMLVEGSRGESGAKPMGNDFAGRAELFAKPDDRWEVNDVANRCPTVVELLRDALVQASQSPAAVADAGLPDVLVSGLE